MSERIDKIWQNEKVARDYLADVQGAIPFAAEQLEIALSLLEAAGGVKRFADLGCGDGVLSRALLGRFPQARGVLVDFAEAMLAVARERLQGQGAELKFLQRDLSDPGWLEGVRQAGPFDAVVSGLAIHHQPDERKRELYGEIFGLLKPGGFFLHLERVAPPSSWLAEYFDRVFVDALHRHHRAGGGGKSREQLAVEYHGRADGETNLLAPVERQCGWLSDCGFTDVDCYFKYFQLALFGGRRPRGHIATSPSRNQEPETSNQKRFSYDKHGQAAK